MSQSYGKYKKSKNRATNKKPYNRSAVDYDEIIDDIIRSNDVDDVRNKAMRYKDQLYGTFLRVGLPTSEYKGMLVRILERMNECNHDQLRMIRLFLFNWEEESLTGIMKVMPNESIYPKYKAILQAVFGNNHPFSNKDGSLDLANSTIVITISEIEKGCSYGMGCTRANPLHKSFMHSIAGGRRKVIQKKKQNKTRKAKKPHKNVKP